MTGAFFAWLLGNPLVAAAIAAAGAFIIGLARGRVTGAQRERDKQARERLEARAEADKIDDAVAGLSDEEVIQRQSKWSRPKH